MEILSRNTKQSIKDNVIINESQVLQQLAELAGKTSQQLQATKLNKTQND